MTDEMMLISQNPEIARAVRKRAYDWIAHQGSEESYKILELEHKLSLAKKALEEAKTKGTAEQYRKIEEVLSEIG